MNFLDIVIVVVYLLGMLYLGYRLSLGNETQEDFFIGGRQMPVIPVALSITATTMSANSFIGGPGWAYEIGMMGFMNQFSIPLIMAIVLTVFIPFFYNLNLTSVYEYIELRLGGISRLMIVVAFGLSSLILVSGFLYIPSLIVNQFTGIPLNAVIPMVVIISMVYTAMGGIKAVIWTDAIQVFLYWGGVIAIFILVLEGIDMNFSDILNVAKESNKLVSLDPTLDISLDNGLWAVLIGAGFMWLQYYATDQSQVQRMFASKSIKSVKKSICISTIAMNISYFIFTFLGVLLFVYYKGKTFDNSNSIMIDFMANHVPSGLLGLIIAAIFAGAMSSVDSVLNSVTTVFTKDIYERFFTKGEEASLGKSRVFTVVFGILIIIVTIMAYSGATASILKVINTYMGYITGSILGVFMLAIFTQKATDKGTAIGFVCGIVMTAVVGQNPQVNWAWLFVVGVFCTIVVGYIASLIIKDAPKEGFEEFTIKGQRELLISQNKTIGADGGVIIPGKIDKFTWIAIISFIIQFAGLYLLQVL